MEGLHNEVDMILVIKGFGNNVLECRVGSACSIIFKNRGVTLQ